LRPGLASLRTLGVVREIEHAFARGCERSTFRLVHYSLQGNHAHLIVEASDREALGRGMMAIASRLARA
jgi:REP element-mobilizing transposase RayT